MLNMPKKTIKVAKKFRQGFLFDQSLTQGNNKKHTPIFHNHSPKVVRF